MKKINKIMILLMTLLVLAPISAKAFTEAASSYKRAYAVKKTSQATNNYSYGSQINEIWLLDPGEYNLTMEKYRAYCLDAGDNVPTATITKSSTIWEGPACALTKYPDISTSAALHNRIRYIHYYSDSNSSCQQYIKVSGNCNSNNTNAVDNGSTISVTNSKNFEEVGDYFVAEVSITKTGSITTYTPTLRSNITGSIITEDINGTTNITTSSSNLLYIKVPKANVASATTINASISASAKYTTTCKYKVPGLIKYIPSQGTTFQRIGYPTWKEESVNKTFTRSSSADYNISGVLVKKYDADSYAPLKNAKFGIYSNNTCTNAVTDQTGDAKIALTDDYGEASFTVDEGTYYVKEINAPSGYEIINDCKMVTAGSSVSFYDRLLGGMTITKIDGKTNLPIKGVKFEIYKQDKTTKATYVNGTAVGELTTNDEGKITLTNMPYGTYYLKETDAPKNYTKQTEMIEVGVTGENDIIILENFPIEIEIIKKDSITEEILEDGKFEILDETNTKVHEFTTTQEYTVLSMTPGTYKLVEVQEPAGYDKNDIIIEFTISEEGEAQITSEESKYFKITANTITIYNDKVEITPDVPKTSAFTGPVAITIGLISIGIGGYYIYYLKKQHKLEK